MAMDAGEIECLIKSTFPDAKVEIRDLAAAAVAVVYDHIFLKLARGDLRHLDGG